NGSGAPLARPLPNTEAGWQAALFVAAELLYQRLADLTLLLVGRGGLGALARALIKRLQQANRLVLLRRIHHGIGAAKVESDLGVRVAGNLVRLLERCHTRALVLLGLVDVRKQRVDGVQRILVLLDLLEHAFALFEHLFRRFVHTKHRVELSQWRVEITNARVVLDGFGVVYQRFLIVTRPQQGLRQPKVTLRVIRVRLDALL